MTMATTMIVDKKTVEIKTNANKASRKTLVETNRNVTKVKNQPERVLVKTIMNVSKTPVKTKPNTSELGKYQENRQLRRVRTPGS